MGNAECRSLALHRILKQARVHGAAIPVDVGAVRFGINDRDTSSQFPIDIRRDFVGRAVGAIHHDRQAFEIKSFGERLLDKLNVAAFGVIDAKRLADFRGRGPK